MPSCLSTVNASGKSIPVPVTQLNAKFVAFGTKIFVLLHEADIPNRSFTLTVTVNVVSFIRAIGRIIQLSTADSPLFKFGTGFVADSPVSRYKPGGSARVASRPMPSARPLFRIVSVTSTEPGTY